MLQTKGPKIPMTPGEDHHVGFNKALTEALKGIHKDFPLGKYDVNVQFQAEVDVHSPGSIGFYRVTITTTT